MNQSRYSQMTYLGRHVLHLFPGFSRARAVLARYGHHFPDAKKMVSQPAPPAEGELAELALKKLEQIVVLLMPVTGHKKIKWFDTIRAALKRLQVLENKADLSPAPAPAEGEVAELVEWLRRHASAQDAAGTHWAGQFTRAAELLEQRHLEPVPVPVSERLPGPGDCLDEGWAWFFSPRVGWRQAVLPVSAAYTHWLPATALPLPAEKPGDK